VKHYPAITGVMRQVHTLRGDPMRIKFRAIEMQDHFPILMTWRSFKVGASPYGGPDECYCPCGEVARPVESSLDLVLGDFVAAAEDHIARRHPDVRR